MASNVFRLAAPVGSNILAAARKAHDAAQSISAGLPAQVVAELTTQVPPAVAAEVTAQMVPLVSDALASKNAAAASALATAADRVQTGLDRTAAAASAAAAAGLVGLMADRIVGTRLSNPAIWNVTRATTAYVRNAAGVLVPVPADMAAWDFDRITLAHKGIAFAGAATNLVLNPRADGGTPGVIGSGGVLPPNLTLSTALPSGLQLQYVGAGTLSTGEPYYDLRWFGTPASSEFTRAQALISSGVAFTTGDPFISRIGYALVAGSLNGFTGYSARLNGPSGTITGGAAPTPTGTVQYVAPIVTVSNASGSTPSSWGVQPLFSFSAGAAIDATFRFVMPICMKRPFIGSAPLPPPGSPGAATEAQTSADILVEKLGAAWAYRQGTIIVEWNSRPGPFTSASDADWFGLVSWGDQSANERLGILVNPAHTSVEARVTAGGVVQAAASRAMSAPTAGQTIRCAVSWDLDAGKMQVAARGAAGAQVALGVLPVPGFVMPGRFGPTHPGFICIAGIECRPAATFDAALAALT